MFLSILLIQRNRHIDENCFAQSSRYGQYRCQYYLYRCSDIGSKIFLKYTWEKVFMQLQKRNNAELSFLFLQVFLKKFNPVNLSHLRSTN